MAYIAFPILHAQDKSKPTNCYFKNICDKNMADLSSQRHWSCEDCDESKQQKCCCCNCPCHANIKQDQMDVKISNEVSEKFKDGLGPEEERHDMFEWMARQRLKDVHAKRESAIHEYATREPLQPEIVHNSIPAKTSDSRNYLNSIQIVQNMKAKWEALTEARNPPVLPLSGSRRRTLVKTVDMFQGVLDTAKKRLNISTNQEIEDHNPNLSTIDETNSVFQSDGTSIQHEDAGTQTHLLPEDPEEVDPLELIVPQIPNEGAIHNHEQITQSSYQLAVPHEIENTENDTLQGFLTPVQSHVPDTIQEIKAYDQEKHVIKSLTHSLGNEELIPDGTKGHAVESLDPQFVDSEVKTSPRYCQEEHANGNISLKCEDHISNPKIILEDSNPEEFPNFELKKHQHRHFIKSNMRASLIPHESIEGLMPITPHSPEAPQLPNPFNDAPTEGSHTSKFRETHEDKMSIEKISEKDLPWYLGWFSLDQNEYKRERIVRENKPIASITTDDDSLTASSIALEIEGHAARRATIVEDELLLNELSADYDKTVITANDAQVVTVHKSKSQLNISTEELKIVAESLSQQRLRTSRDDSKDLKFEREFHICHKCKKVVKSGDATFQFQNGHQSVWHRKCFVCTKCQKPLGLMDHLFFEEEPYCYNDYVIVAHVPKCNGCHEFIFDPTYTSAAGHFWHKNHFTCHKCHKSLVDTKYVLVNGRIYCFSCHQKDFIRICKSCNKTILPNESYVQSGVYFWHSNDSCLHCETCTRSLIGRSFFFRKAGHLYCNRYCALGRGPPV